MSLASRSSLPLSLRSLLLIALWSLALLGTLLFHRLEGLDGHAICGPWGCGPPLPALVGYHAFWSLLIFPAAVILKRRCNLTAGRKFGLALMLASTAGIAALLLLDGLDNSAAEKYLLRWSLFRVATFVDVPLVQLGLAGLWLRYHRLGRSQRQSIKDENSADARRATTQATDV